MGKRNSSATRVWPVFQNLIERDKCGRTWLPALLKLFPNQSSFNPEVLLNPGDIAGFQFGKKELCLNPPLRFLKWMVEHPHELTWPSYQIKTEYIRDMRERLMLRGSYENTPEAQRQAIESGKAEIERALANSRDGDSTWLDRWWVLEGRTHVDCYIETTHIRLFVEGKRTDKLSSKTSWYRKRNQLLRNLESASVHASGQPFAQLLMTEKPAPELEPGIVKSSLPHLSSNERDELLSHYAGAVTWRSICSAVDLPYEKLPDTVTTP